MARTWAVFVGGVALAVAWRAEAEDWSAQPLRGRLLTKFEFGETSRMVETRFWQKGGNYRTEREGRQGRRIFIRSGEWLFAYRDGAADGAKIAAANVDSPLLQNPLEQMLLLKANGTKIGEETLEEGECDKYEVQIGNTTGFLWIARTTQLPVQSFAEFPRGKVTVRVVNVEQEKELADELFLPPVGVVFREVSDPRELFSQPQQP